MDAARIVRCDRIPGTIITDQVGHIEVGGKIVADFCEVDPGWFYSTGCDDDEVANDEDVFAGSEAEILAHYSAR